MVTHIICYIILILSIDIYYILYKKYKELVLKRQHALEKKYGYTDEQLSKIEDISSKVPIIIYSLSAIVGGFYCNFINHFLFSNTNFFHVLLVNFEMVLLCLCAYLSFSVIFNYIKSIVLFLIGFKNGFFKK